MRRNDLFDGGEEPILLEPFLGRHVGGERFSYGSCFGIAVAIGAENGNDALLHGRLKVLDGRRWNVVGASSPRHIVEHNHHANQRIFFSADFKLNRSLDKNGDGRWREMRRMNDEDEDD